MHDYTAEMAKSAQRGRAAIARGLRAVANSSEVTRRDAAVLRKMARRVGGVNAFERARDRVQTGLDLTARAREQRTLGSIEVQVPLSSAGEV